MRRIKIIGLVRGGSTAFDGLYVREYDPKRRGVDPNGEPMTAYLVCTPDVDLAMTFNNAGDAMEKWRESSGRIRPDGKPDRPLTSFTVEVV